MRKPPKPWRRKKGGKFVGNWFATPYTDDANQQAFSLGTKDARVANERAREYAQTRKRNFQDDLDGAAERTIAAVQGAAENPPLASGAAPIVEQPAARVVAAPAAAPIPTPTPTPEPVPTTAATPAAAVPGSTPTPAAPPPVADWREAARAAAAETAIASDNKPPTPMQLDPSVIEKALKTVATFAFGAQLFLQGKGIEWWTGEKVPPLLPTLKAAVEAKQLPADALEAIEGARDISITAWESFIRRKVDLTNVPDYLLALGFAGSLASVQYSFAAVAKAQKERAKTQRNGSPGMPPGTPAAPPPADSNTAASAEA